jgi:hypothetical protein
VKLLPDWDDDADSWSVCVPGSDSSWSELAAVSVTESDDDPVAV